MRGLQNIVLILVCSALLIAPLGLQVLHKAGVAVPESTGLDRTYTELEGRYLAKRPELSLQSFEDGSFQSGFESWLADGTVYRDESILVTAEWQRQLIRTAALVFGFDAYPPFYGSSYAASVGSNVVMPQMRTQNENEMKNALIWAQTFRNLSEKYPDVRFVYDDIEEPYTTPSNPTFALQSDAYPPSWTEDNMYQLIGEAVTVVDDKIQSQEELFTQWHGNEHHWRLERALDSYNAIGRELGWKPVDYSPDLLVTDGFIGSNARLGRTLDFPDTLWDMNTDFSNLSVTVDGQPSDRGKRDALMRGEEVDFGDPSYAVYHQYYGLPRTEVIYTNETADNDRVCLFVEQSYGVLLEPYIAQNYRTTICIDPMNCKVGRSISSYIDQYGVDDVVFQAGFTSLWYIADRSPHVMFDTDEPLEGEQTEEAA